MATSRPKVDCNESNEVKRWKRTILPRLLSNVSCSANDIRHNHFFNDYFAPIPEALVSLLLCLVKKCPSVCNINHFVVLLGAYGATLSTTGKAMYLGVCVCLLVPGLESIEFQFNQFKICTEIAVYLMIIEYPFSCSCQ